VFGESKTVKPFETERGILRKIGNQWGDPDISVANHGIVRVRTWLSAFASKCLVLKDKESGPKINSLHFVVGSQTFSSDGF
jgi:hypothetical protein